MEQWSPGRWCARPRTAPPISNGPVTSRIRLTRNEQIELRERAERTDRPQEARRARIVLLADEGWSVAAIARRVGVSRPTVTAWRDRFANDRLAGLTDSPRSGRPRMVNPEAVLRATLRGQADAVWIRSTTREVGSFLGVSPSTVARTWREYGIVPHRSGRLDFAIVPRLRVRGVRILGRYSASGGEIVIIGTGDLGQHNDTAPDDDGAMWRNLKQLARCVDAPRRGEQSAIHVVADPHGRTELTRSPAHRAWWAIHPFVTVHSVEPGIQWSRLLDTWRLAGQELAARE